MEIMGTERNRPGMLSLGTLLAVLVLFACRESNRTPVPETAAADINNFTPVVMSELALPIPVKGSDGRYHFVYELMLSNSNNAEWQVLSVEVLNANGDERPLYTLDGDQVSANMSQLGTRKAVDRLAPAQSGLVFIQFAVDGEKNIPDSLLHRLTITVPGGIPQAIANFIRLPPGQERLTETGVPVPVNRQPVLALAPPLEGGNWVAANGCCDSITHVRTDLPVNGEIHISQRFAIDWIKIDEERRLYAGDPGELQSWAGYEQEVLAVADGIVVTVVDKYSNQTPFALPTDTGAITLEEIDGNHVIIALGNGHYAFYAHLKPGSIQVAKGERVRAGQVLGLLGNTGNSSAPHLHFHIMQSGSSLGSNGLPYTFKVFTLVGNTTEHSFFDVGLEDNTPFADETGAVIEGNPIEVLPLPNAGPRRDELPLNLNVVQFPQARSSVKDTENP